VEASTRAGICEQSGFCSTRLAGGSACPTTSVNRDRVESYLEFPYAPMFLLVLPALLAAAPALEIVRPIVAQSEGGVPTPASYEHVAGKRCSSLRVAAIRKSSEEKIHVAFSVQAFDPKGVPIVELYKNELVAEVTPQDKEWMPKIETEVQIPPLAPRARTRSWSRPKTCWPRPRLNWPCRFKWRARCRAERDAGGAQLPFLPRRDDAQPLDKSIYHPGDGVWAKFDITVSSTGQQPRGRELRDFVIAPSGKCCGPSRTRRGAVGILLPQTLRRRLVRHQPAEQHPSANTPLR